MTLLKAFIFTCGGLGFITGILAFSFNKIFYGTNVEILEKYCIVDGKNAGIEMFKVVTKMYTISWLTTIFWLLSLICLVTQRAILALILASLIIWYVVNEAQFINEIFHVYMFM